MNWPRTLVGRVMLILVAGVALAQGLTIAVVLVERGLVMRSVMVAYLTADVGSSVAMLDRLPVGERESWLPRLERPNYRLVLGASPAPDPDAASRWPLAASIAESLATTLKQPVTLGIGASQGQQQIGTRLQDGTPLLVELAPPGLQLSPWLKAALAAQLLLLLGCGWLVVRQATQPLARLASAARDLLPGRPAPPLPEQGPHEVADAARAFNLMRSRVDAHVHERSQMLGAISHDLQSPIARMRLRVEMLDDETLRDRLQSDLGQMQHLVEQGLVFARTQQALLEPETRTDLAALAESVVADHQDASRPVHWLGGRAPAVLTRPQALRRIVGNLVDNAVKFGGRAEVALESSGSTVHLHVMDRGAGIPADECDKVMQPFYRVEASRNAATGGSGLGLAIVKQLLDPCRAELSLTSRPGGGLQATLSFRCVEGPGEARGTLARPNG